VRALRRIIESIPASDKLVVAGSVRLLVLPKAHNKSSMPLEVCLKTTGRMRSS